MGIPAITFTQRNRRQRTRMMMRCFPLLEVPGIAWNERSSINWSWAFGDTSITSKWLMKLCPKKCATMGCMILTLGIGSNGGCVERWPWEMPKPLIPWLSPNHPTTVPLPASLPTISCLQCRSWKSMIHKLRWEFLNMTWNWLKRLPFLSPSLANSSLKTPMIHEAIGMRFFTWNIHLALCICQDLVAGSSSCLWNPYNVLMDLASWNNVQVTSMYNNFYIS